MELLNLLMPLIIAVFVLAAPACLILGIVFFVLAKNKPEEKKTKVRVWSVVLAAAPIVLLFVLITLWGLLRVWERTQI